MKQEMNAPPSKKRNVDYSLFNKMSYQKQCQFNFGQFELVEETIQLIEQEAISRPLERLQKIKANLWKGNKSIKRSKSLAGQNMVKEYKTDSLASDSDGDRRVGRAEKRAMKKSQSVVSKSTVR